MYVRREFAGSRPHGRAGAEIAPYPTAQVGCFSDIDDTAFLVLEEVDSRLCWQGSQLLVFHDGIIVASGLYAGKNDADYATIGIYRMISRR